MVGLEAEILIGLHSVAALVLKLVSLELGHESNPPAFLKFVDQHARSGFGDQCQRHLKLLTAVPAQRTEYVSGEALRVDTDQRRRGGDIAHHKSDGFSLPAAVA